MRSRPRVIAGTVLLALMLATLALWKTSVRSGEPAKESGVRRSLTIFRAWSPKSVKNVTGRREASIGLRKARASLIEDSMRLLRENAGREPAKMKPDYVAVREAIEQLGALSGFCRRTGKSADITRLMAKFTTVDLMFVSTDGLPPLGTGRRPGQLTSAGSNLTLFGVHAASAILADIAAGGLGDELKPGNRGALYKPYAYSKILEAIFGDSELVIRYLEYRARGKGKSSARVEAFLDYYKRFYPGRQEDKGANL